MSDAVLEARGIVKVFPGVRACDGIDFIVRRGEIHALMGENGAGKSTLLKVLTGAYQRDSGEVLLEGQPISPRSPAHAQTLGISTVYQEVNLIPTLSVAENLFLGRQPMKWGRIDWAAMQRGAEAALSRLNVHLDVTRLLGSYSIAIQQMVAIARALDVSAKLLILDEPTSSLDADEVRQLFDLLKRLRGEGLGIVFVTHFLGQVYEITDRITVLRNGKLVGEYLTKDLPKLELIQAMMGRELAAFELRQTGDEPPAARATPFVQTKKLGRKNAVQDVDLDIAPGEVVGIAGLLGSGRTETARLLFGIDKPDEGEILIDGRPTKLSSPRTAIRERFAFCPEDRKTQGIIPDLSVRENVALALQSGRGWISALSKAKQRELADRFIKAINIATRDAETPVKNLSGGNQQKVILARWLASNPRLLILDEPTRGIDVGAKAEIQKLILSLAKEGMSILFISSELEEVVRCCSRVAVLRDRRKVDELRGDISEEQIMRSIAGGAA
jgi:monosaccharide-transporting ATPase